MWNVRLLERSRNGLVLTSEGMQILPYVRRLVDERMLEWANSLEDFSGTVKKVLNNHRKGEK